MLEAIAIYLLCVGGGAYAAGDGAGARGGHRDEVEVEIVGDEGRIRVPVRMRPKQRPGGRDGWWKLKALDMGADEIRGRISLGPFDKPRLRIDRLTGRISIRGRGGDFDGLCEARQSSEVGRRF